MSSGRKSNGSMSSHPEMRYVEVIVQYCYYGDQTLTISSLRPELLGIDLETLYAMGKSMIGAAGQHRTILYTPSSILVHISVCSGFRHPIFRYIVYFCHHSRRSPSPLIQHHTRYIHTRLLSPLLCAAFRRLSFEYPANSDTRLRSVFHALFALAHCSSVRLSYLVSD